MMMFQKTRSKKKARLIHSKEQHKLQCSRIHYRRWRCAANDQEGKKKKKGGGGGAIPNGPERNVITAKEGPMQVRIEARRTATVTSACING